MKKAWDGEEKLWKVFWLWGVVLYLSAIPIGFAALGLRNICPNILTSIIAISVGILGMIFAFIYPIVFCVALWRCAGNTNNKRYFVPSRIFILPFLLLHIVVGYISFFGGIGLILIAVSEPIYQQHYCVH